MLQLENDRFIDIPHNDSEFVVRDQLTLPVDDDGYGVYPHLHYLGKNAEGIATLPDGTWKYLIRAGAEGTHDRLRAFVLRQWHSAGSLDSAKVTISAMNRAKLRLLYFQTVEFQLAPRYAPRQSAHGDSMWVKVRDHRMS